MAFSSQKKILISTIFILLLVNIYVILSVKEVNILTSIQNANFSFSNLISKKPSCRDCNIILISVDTLGAKHLPCYGYTRNTSPNLCKFGQENIFVQDMTANSSYTLPSHVSIFTGLYPREHGVNIPNVDRLDKKIPFLPEELKKNGYETYFCMTTVDPHLSIDKIYNRGIDKIYGSYKLEDWNDCLKKLSENNKKNKKTFIFLHTYRVHSPYVASPKNPYLSKLSTKKIPSIPETTEDLSLIKYEDEFFRFFIKKLEEDLRDKFWGDDKKAINYHTNLLSMAKGAITREDRHLLLDDEKNEFTIFDYLYSYYSYRSNLLPKNQVARLSDMYDVAIMELDVFLGKMLGALRKTKLWDNTIVLVTSDHGEEFMEHERVVGHGANLYNTTTKIPLMMHIPNTHKKRITVPAESVDIFPTLLNLVGIKNTIRFSGSDMFGIKNGIQKSDLFYSDYYVRTIRDKDWKLIIKRENSAYSGRELYDISIDQDEKTNRIFENPSKSSILLKIFRENELRILNKQGPLLRDQ
ncbi:MAG: sulfatase [Microgenomates group bacterium]